MNDDQVIRYTCPKCGSKKSMKCRFTELYKVPKKRIGEMINFMTR